MNDDIATVEMDETVEFTTLAGESFPLTLATLQRSADGDQVHATLVADYDTWMQIADEGAFHLDDVDDRPELHPDRGVQLQVRLRPRLLDRLSDDLSAVTDLVSQPTDPLWQTSAWFVTAIVPALDRSDDVDAEVSSGIAQIGLHTDWAEFFSEDDDRSASAAVTDHFESEGWEYEEPESDLVEIEITMRGQSFPVYIYTDGEERVCRLYAVHPDTVPEPNWPALTQTLATRNYELERGAFGLNRMDGSVRYRRRADLERESIGEAFDATVSAMVSIYDDVARWGMPDDE